MSGRRLSCAATRHGAGQQQAGEGERQQRSWKQDGACGSIDVETGRQDAGPRPAGRERRLIRVNPSGHDTSQVRAGKVARPTPYSTCTATAKFPESP